MDILDGIMSNETEETRNPLPKARDEEAAELLAFHGTVASVARKMKGKQGFTAKHLYSLLGGSNGVTQARCVAFRGRVKFYVNEMKRELRAKRLSLKVKAAEVYEHFLEPDDIDDHAPQAVTAATETLKGTQFFKGAQQIDVGGDVGELVKGIIAVINQEVADQTTKLAIAERLMELAKGGEK